MKNAGFINSQMSYRVDLNATLAKLEIKVDFFFKIFKSRPVNHDRVNRNHVFMKINCMLLFPSSYKHKCQYVCPLVCLQQCLRDFTGIINYIYRSCLKNV